MLIVEGIIKTDRIFNVSRKLVRMNIDSMSKGDSKQDQKNDIWTN